MLAGCTTLGQTTDLWSSFEGHCIPFSVLSVSISCQTSEQGSREHQKKRSDPTGASTEGMERPTHILICHAGKGNAYNNLETTQQYFFLFHCEDKTQETVGNPWQKGRNKKGPRVTNHSAGTMIGKIHTLADFSATNSKHQGTFCGRPCTLVEFPKESLKSLPCLFGLWFAQGKRRGKRGCRNQNQKDSTPQAK